MGERLPPTRCNRSDSRPWDSCRSDMPYSWGFLYVPHGGSRRRARSGPLDCSLLQRAGLDTPEQDFGLRGRHGRAPARKVGAAPGSAFVTASAQTGGLDRLGRQARLGSARGTNRRRHPQH